MRSLRTTKVYYTRCVYVVSNYRAIGLQNNFSMRCIDQFFNIKEQIQIIQSFRDDNQRDIEDYHSDLEKYLTVDSYYVDMPSRSGVGKFPTLFQTFCYNILSLFDFD